MKRGYNQTKKETGDGFYSSQAEDFKMGKALRAVTAVRSQRHSQIYF